MIAVQQLTKKLSLNQIKNAEQVLLGQAQKKPVRQKVDSRKVMLTLFIVGAGQHLGASCSSKTLLVQLVAVVSIR